MSDTLPVAAFKAYTKSLPLFYDESALTWDTLIPIKRKAWEAAVAAILDAITPRSC